MKKTVRLLLVLCTFYSVSAKNPLTTVALDTTVVSYENVVYKVARDKENLYLSISTSDNDIIKSMLHLGVTVFFDIEGKENEDVYIKYPLEPIRPNFSREQVPLEGFQTLEEENRIKHNIAKLIQDDLPQEAEYHYFDSQERFHILLNSLDASISYTYSEEKGLLEYHLKIPMHKISTDSKEDFSELAIGVKTNEMPDSKQKKDDNSRGQRSNTRGGGRPSGGRGGGKGRPNTSERSEGRNNQQSIKKIDYWFKVSE